MKIALIHDYLNQFGGGERVLLSLMKMFPEAPVYTILYDKEKTFGVFEGRIKKTSFLDFPFARKHHRLFIPLMPLAARSIDLKGEYDLIISDTAGFAKGISYNRTRTKHISYIHTPLRYAWETSTYFGNSFVARLFAFIFTPAFAYMRHADYNSAQKPDVLIANSNYIAGKIKKYYNRDAQVVYPPVDTSRFYRDGKSQIANRKSYYLALGRFLEYKRFDLIIEAFNQLQMPLKIVGAGRMEKKLKKLATSAKIEFLPFQSDEKLRELYAGAKAFIMANEEDFGMVMTESLACGTPVIAYGRGGALEIVEDPSAGSGQVAKAILFNEQTPESLIAAVKKFETMKFDRKKISESAQRFSEENFKKGIRSALVKL